jgi:hypothetical protein
MATLGRHRNEADEHVVDAAMMHRLREHSHRQGGAAVRWGSRTLYGPLRAQMFSVSTRTRRVYRGDLRRRLNRGVSGRLLWMWDP